MRRRQFQILAPIFLTAFSFAFTSCTRSNPPPSEGTRNSAQSGSLNGSNQVGGDQQILSKDGVSSSVGIPTMLKFTLSKGGGGSAVFASDWDGMTTRSQINGVLLK